MSFFRLVWPIPAVLLILVGLLIVTNEYAMARPSRRIKDIAYLDVNSPNISTERNVLDVYAPKQKSPSGYPVVIFIHGGNWDSGSKNLYSFVGRRLAKQNVVAVIINYRLAPGALVPAMADDCAHVVLWTTQHIAEYGGDPNRIFTMGHSAGGGLAALMATKDELFTKLGLLRNPVKGAILDDPAGLDMYDYLKKMQYPNDQQYLVSFGKDQAVWRSVSPMHFVGKDTPPMLIYIGGRSYPSIINSGSNFRKKLQTLGVKHEYTVLPGKKHIPMVIQLLWKNNVIYRDLIQFVGAGQ
jgi:acetyl esterase/lipase